MNELLPDGVLSRDKVPSPEGVAGLLRCLGRRSLDTLLPPRCFVCQIMLDARDTLCGGCWSSVQFIRAPLCDRMGIPLPYAVGEITVSAAALANPPAYDRARAVAHFSGGMRTMVHQLKYADRLDGRVLLGHWLQVAGAELIADADLIVPVPLSRSRLLWRRFNQAALLGQQLARTTGHTFVPGALVRRRSTRPQVGLTQAQRRQNVSGAFEVLKRRQGFIRDRNVLLIDDVITTGATVEACARALRRAGAKRVDVLALGLVTNEARVLV
jgi:ComF family protein